MPAYTFSCASCKVDAFAPTNKTRPPLPTKFPSTSFVPAWNTACEADRAARLGNAFPFQRPWIAFSCDYYT